MLARLNPDGLSASLLAAIVAMLGLMPILILPLFVGSIVDHQGFGTGAAGVVVSMNLLGNALGVLLFSLVMRGLSLRQFVYLGAGLEIAADLLTIELDAPFTGLLLLRLAAGCGGGLVTGAAFNWMARRADPDRGFGLLFAGQFLISAVLLVTLPFVIPDFGVTTFYVLFIVTAIVSVACSPVLAAGEPSRGTRALVVEPGAGPEPHGVETRRDTAPLAITGISLALISVALFEIAASGIWAYIERIGVAWKFSLEHIGLALSVGSLSGVPGGLLVVAFGSRWGRTKPILWGVICGVAGLAVLLAGIEAFWIYLTSILVFSAAWAFTVPYIQGVQAQLDPSGRVAVLGLFVVLLAIAAGPFVFGWLIGGQGYYTAIVFACLLLGACLFTVFGVARKQDLAPLGKHPSS